jgi:hypothetical protein
MSVARTVLRSFDVRNVAREDRSLVGAAGCSQRTGTPPERTPPADSTPTDRASPTDGPPSAPPDVAPLDGSWVTTAPALAEAFLFVGDAVGRVHAFGPADR